MRAVDIVRKKRDGRELARDEIGFLIREYCAGRIPDYQMSAFLMAVFFKGMTTPEISALTEEMRISGEVVDLGFIPGRKVDKHSTGGVGDKTSLVLAPAVAAAGVTVPMMSGRGLGHTGGTLDKLESIPGFNVRLSSAQFKAQLAAAGLSFIGQTENLVPADRKLYALRDVTATVESQPLITASIMSKKLAEGIDGLVLDVKTGSGAFMQRREDAESLARAMVALGKACGKRVVALVTDMNQPLGDYAGNALEVIECVEMLKGRGPADLATLCEDLSAHCLVLGEAARDLDEGRKLYGATVTSGKALDKLREVIRLQGGDARIVDDYGALPAARRRLPMAAQSGGFVQSMNTQEIGLALCVLGAGRETVDSIIDPAVGIQFHKKIGEAVAAGEPLCTIYFNDEDRCRDAMKRMTEAYVIGSAAVERPLLIKKTIG
jgi:pyrimidine-nucleoside phosphorylase